MVQVLLTIHKVFRNWLFLKEVFLIRQSESVIGLTHSHCARPIWNYEHIYFWIFRFFGPIAIINGIEKCYKK